MILEPPASVQKLQTALQAKAKEAPDYRFYLLYDKLYRKDVLEYAYRCCKANGGAPGVDSQDFADIEAYGEERWLGELADRLRGKTYRAEAVRRVWIPKADGRKRPLGVPCIADRTVMTAAVAVLSPIFDVDLPAEQHGYRAHFSAHTAVRSVRGLIDTGHTKIIEGDLAGSTPGKDSGRGVPQGSPISPLLGNLYMRRFVLGWKRRGVESRLQAKIVSYADDYVICCKGDVDEALAEMHWMMRRLKLTVNEAKTRVCHLPKDRFDFLGYSFGRYYSPQTGRAYLCAWPSKKSVQRLIGAIREATERRVLWMEADEMVQTINRKLLGWANYFSLAKPTG